MSDWDIMHLSSKGGIVLDLSKEGEEYFKSFVDNLPNSKGIIEPYSQRPPVKRFHSEEHLNSAKYKDLLQVTRREKLKTCQSPKKKEMIQKILQHQKDRNNSQIYVPVPRY